MKPELKQKTQLLGFKYIGEFMNYAARWPDYGAIGFAAHRDDVDARSFYLWLMRRRKTLEAKKALVRWFRERMTA